MPPTLGITVTIRSALLHVLGLAEAAKLDGKQTDVFLTGDGVHLTHEHRFPELLDIARVGVCEVSYRANGYSEKAVLGLTDKDFVTQARNAEMVAECDRYLVL